MRYNVHNAKDINQKQKLRKTILKYVKLLSNFKNKNTESRRNKIDNIVIEDGHDCIKMIHNH